MLFINWELDLDGNVEEKIFFEERSLNSLMLVGMRVA